MRKLDLTKLAVVMISIIMTIGFAMGLSACELLDRFLSGPVNPNPNEQNTTTSNDLNHVHSVVVDEAVAPTCTKTGLTEGKHCSTCNEVIVMQEIVPVLEHQYKNSVCVICGAEDHTQYFEFELLDNDTYEIAQVKSNYPEKLSIPATYLGKDVTSIGSGAFFDCKSLTSLSIPDSIENVSIWMFLFTGGDFMEEDNGVYYVDKWALAVDISQTSVTYRDGTVGIGLSSLGGDKLMSVTIPSSVTKIVAPYAMLSVNVITSLSVAEDNPIYYSKDNCVIERESRALILGCNSSVIPNEVTRISPYAFCGCSSLTNITIPNGVTNIDFGAFEYCGSLTSITLPNSLISIEEEAFQKCSSLTSVTIPDGVSSIGGEAFSGCTSLTSITLGKGITYIGPSAFNASKLVSIQFSGTIAEWDAIIAQVSMKDFGNKIVYCANGNSCTSHTVVVDTPVQAPTCTSIGFTESAHCSVCGSILSVRETIKELGHNAVIDKSVAPTCIETGLTEGKHCKTCGEILIAQMVEDKIEHNYAPIVTPPTATLDGYVKHSCAFCGYVSHTDTITPIDFTITKNNRHQIGYTGKKSEVLVIPAVFQQENVWYRVVAIGEQAFVDCTSLTKVTIPDSVTHIGAAAFFACSALTNINIPCSAQFSAFDLPVFAFCGALKRIDVDSKNPYYYYENNCLISKVDHWLIRACQNSVIPDDVTVIASWAFSGMSNLTSITIPNSVTMIGSYAFENCTNLTSITVPEGVLILGSGVFEGCSNLKKVVIKGRETHLETLFYDCTALTSVTLPDSITHIGVSNFENCTNLTYLTFNGTKAQWNAISKNANWKKGSNITTIICSDGAITLN